MKGRRFTESSVRKLLVRCTETKLLTPRRFLEAMLERMRQEHEAAGDDEPFMRPGYPRLAKVLTEAGYATPRGRGIWWPGQINSLKVDSTTTEERFLTVGVAVAAHTRK